MKNPGKKMLRWCGLLLLLPALLVKADETLIASFTETAVQLPGQHYEVPAIWVRPVATEQSFPVVVLLHGTASQKNEVGNLFLRLSRNLAQQGIASIRIDFAGTGDSKVDYRHYHLTGAQADVRTTVDYLLKQPGVDAGKIAVLGFSQGGLVAQLVAANDQRIAALVTWSSAVGNGRGAFHFLFKEYQAEAEQNGYARVHFPWRAEPLHFGHQWFQEIDSNTSLDQIQGYKNPVLAVAGMEDDIVSYRASLALIEAVSHPQSEAVVLRGADHMFNVLGDANSNGLAADQSMAELLLSLTTSWLQKNL